MTLSGGRECVWCGSPANSLEHVYPQWLRKLPGPATFIAQHGGYQDPSPQLVTRADGSGGWEEYLSTRGTRTPNVHEVQVKAVCASCNNNWMSQMETEVEPIVRKLAQGQVSLVPAHEARTLAVWAHKTFLMYNQWEDKRDRRYSAEDYEEFHEDRVPAADVRLYLTYCPEATIGLWSDSRCVIPPGADAAAYMDAHHPNCASSLIALDGLVIMEHWFARDYPTHARVKKFASPVRSASHARMQKSGIHQLWPEPTDLHDWRRTELSGRQVEAARLSLRKALRTRRVFATRVTKPQ